MATLGASAPSWGALTTRGRRAGQAEHAIWDRLQSSSRDWIAAGVACPIGPIVELRERTLGAGEPALE